MSAEQHSFIKVLVIEDEPDLQIIYRDVLSREGFEVEIAPDGGVALEKIRAGAYDLLVVDFLLPRVDGVEVLEEVAQLRPTPAIFASAVMRDPVTIQHLKNLGVRWFLEKPFRLSALRAILDEAREVIASPNVKLGQG